MLLDELVLADGLAKLHALGCVMRRILKRALGGTKALGACDQALDLEIHHGLHEAVALNAHEVLLFEDDVFHMKLAGVAHIPADFLERLNGDARREVALVVAQGHPPHAELRTVLAQSGIVGRIARDAKHVLRVHGVGHERLIAIEVHLAIATLVRRSERARVGAGTRLGEAKHEARSTSHNFSEALLLLLGRAVFGHILERAQVAVHVDRRAIFADALRNQHKRRHVNGRTAELLVDAEHLEAVFEQCVGKFRRPLMLLVALLEILLGAIALHQLVDALKQQLLFFGKGEIHGFPFLCFPHPCLTITASHNCAAILKSN